MDDLYGNFNVKFEGGMLSVNPEMIPTPGGFHPTGRYHVYCLHPDYGSCTFIVEQDEQGMWFAEVKPPFLSNQFIEVVGNQIENFHA